LDDPALQNQSCGMSSVVCAEFGENVFNCAHDDFSDIDSCVAICFFAIPAIARRHPCRSNEATQDGIADEIC
jgi:hypothetical protein